MSMDATMQKIMELTGVDPEAKPGTTEAAAPDLEPAKYLCCDACGKTHDYTGTIDANCPCCNTAARQWPGKTLKEAMERRERMKRMAPTQKQETQNETSGNAEKELGDRPAPVVPQETGDAGSGDKPEPKVARTRKPRAAKNEPAPPPAASGDSGAGGGSSPQPPAGDQPQPQPVAPAPEPAGGTDEGVDFKALREAFKVAMALNTVNWKPVGTAVVGSPGFTLWSEVDGRRIPSYRFMESFDDPFSFRALYESFQRTNPNTRFDVVRVRGVAGAVKPLAFQGEVVATTNLGEGAAVLKPGAPVILFAKLSKSGSIVFGAAFNPNPTPSAK